MHPRAPTRCNTQSRMKSGRTRRRKELRHVSKLALLGHTLPSQRSPEIQEGRCLTRQAPPTTAEGTAKESTSEAPEHSPGSFPHQSQTTTTVTVPRLSPIINHEPNVEPERPERARVTGPAMSTKEVIWEYNCRYWFLLTNGLMASLSPLFPGCCHGDYSWCEQRPYH